MNHDDFEQQLQNQPFRAVPPRWREEILRNAQAAFVGSGRGKVQQPEAERRPAGAAAPAWWQEWLWPSPHAWAGLALLWLILLGLYWADAPASSSSIAQLQPPTPEARVALAAQRLEMSRLLDGPLEPLPATKPAVPGPRSERIAPSKA